jgi:hypothetical protein
MVNESTRVAQHILDQAGYLIVAWGVGSSQPCPRIGEQYDLPFWSMGESVDGPYFVRAEASIDDYVEQARRFGLMVTPLWYYREEAEAAYSKYFRVVAE